MISRTVSILIAATILGLGSTYLVRRNTPAPASTAPVKQETVEDVVQEPRKEQVATPLPRPAPEPVIQKTAAIPPPPVTAPKRQKPVKKQAPPDYWQARAQQFNRLQELLSRETNAAKRNNLIQNIARYVRVDTLGTLEWAMGLTDPEEKQAALEAVNKNALTGIGARIEVDDTGLPKISETTILSAVASTGQVEPGDYIAGVVKEDGSTVYFNNLSPREIVQILRGKPGTEILLLMERAATDNQPEPYSFDVAVERSLIVIHPPL